MKVSGPSAFRSLAYFNFRMWFWGALVSNAGTWMQRLAQNWLVLTELTRHDAAAVGYVSALQFGPQILLLPWTGAVIDSFNRRKILIATQSAMAILAFSLGVLVVSHLAQLWHVYLLAAVQGIVIAFDAPARQTFVADMVGEKDLTNAIALNSTINNVSRMIGPAIAGAVIATLGSGWGFLANGISFAASLGALAAMRPGDLLQQHAKVPSGGLSEGLVNIWTRSELLIAFSMIFLLGTFAMNFPLFISTMSASTFKVGASGFGILTSVMAVGSVAGAILAARLEKPKMPLLVASCCGLGIGLTVAALVPTYASFGVCLVMLGILSQVFLTGANGFVQMSAEPAVRGRVVASMLVAAQGGTVIGAPLIGWIANLAGPRWGIGVGAFSGVLGGTIGGLYLLARHRAAHEEKTGDLDPTTDSSAVEGGSGTQSESAI